MKFQRVLAVGLVSFGVATGVGGSQQTSQMPQMPQVPGQPSSQPGSSTDPFNKGNDFPNLSMSARQQKMRNEERQQRLVADTNKLLALATQLHDDVTKTDKNILSLDVVRRADEIEKLAHSVKEREKTE